MTNDAQELLLHPIKNQYNLHDAMAQAKAQQLSIAEEGAGAAKLRQLRGHAYGSQGMGNELDASGMQKAKNAMLRALKELGQRNNGPVTGDMVRQYQQDMQAGFSAKVRLEVTRLGVSPETEFTMTLDGKGGLTVVCDIPADKAILEKYVRDSPELAEQLEYIQALGSYEQIRQSTMSNPYKARANIKAEIQSSVVEAFFSGAQQNGMQLADMQAQFSAGGQEANFYRGINFMV